VGDSALDASHDWLIHFAVIAVCLTLWVVLYCKALRPMFQRLAIRTSKIVWSSLAFGVIVTVLLIAIGYRSPTRAKLPWEANDAISFLNAISLVLLSLVIPALATFWIFGALAISRAARSSRVGGNSTG
jgi:hypothetical protein